ncbi:MAG: TetR/AcrR family transcriptional regulator [Lachnospiraceae bacterium]
MEDTGLKKDLRTVRTKTRIKQTFLELMKKKAFGKITVTEICSSLGINRGTFYLHYQDLYDVLDELEEELLQLEDTPEHYQCSLSSEQYECPYGICDKIRLHPEYGVIFFDSTLAEHIVEKIARKSREKYVKALMQECTLAEWEADKIFYFQLNGCLAINREIYRSGGKDWEKSRDLIGGFIQSGLKRYKK